MITVALYAHMEVQLKFSWSKETYNGINAPITSRTLNNHAKDASTDMVFAWYWAVGMGGFSWRKGFFGKRRLVGVGLKQASALC